MRRRLVRGHHQSRRERPCYKHARTPGGGYRMAVDEGCCRAAGVRRMLLTPLTGAGCNLSNTVR